MEINTEILLTIAGLFISSISLLFLIFTAGIAFVAILEWRSYKDFQKKKKEAETQYKQVIGQMIIAKKNFMKEANLILRAKKSVGKKDETIQKKQINNLICQMEDIIKRAENKLDMTGTISHTIGTGESLGYFSGNSLLETDKFSPKIGVGFADNIGIKECSNCHKTYYPLFTSIDDGLCDDCKNNDILSKIINKK